MSYFEWRYTERGQVKHALRASSDRVAVCGVSPRWFAPDWYGTGKQSEYERLEVLLPCKRCVEKGAKP